MIVPVLRSSKPQLGMLSIVLPASLPGVEPGERIDVMGPIKTTKDSIAELLHYATKVSLVVSGAHLADLLPLPLSRSTYSRRVHVTVITVGETALFAEYCERIHQTFDIKEVEDVDEAVKILRDYPATKEHPVIFALDDPSTTKIVTEIGTEFSITLIPPKSTNNCPLVTRHDAVM